MWAQPVPLLFCVATLSRVGFAVQAVIQEESKKNRYSNVMRREDVSSHRRTSQSIAKQRLSWWERVPLARKVHSQNDEDGIIEYLFKNLGTTNKQYVEFGAEDGTECNTRRLRETFGWHGLTMDGSHNNAKIGLHKEYITPVNIAGLFRKYKVLYEPDLVSVDVDSFDAFVLKSILSAGYRPRVLVVEANDHFGDSSYLSFPGDTNVSKFEMTNCGQICTFNDPRDSHRKKTAFCGAGTRAVDFVASKAGYHLVNLNAVNMFFIRNDIAPEGMLHQWSFDRVMEQSKKLGRRKMSFPPVGCAHLNTGLVDVRTAN